MDKKKIIRAQKSYNPKPTGKKPPNKPPPPPSPSKKNKFAIIWV